MKWVDYYFCYFCSCDWIVWTKNSLSVHDLSWDNIKECRSFYIFCKIRSSPHVSKCHSRHFIHGHSESNRENFCRFCSRDWVIWTETSTILYHSSWESERYILSIPGTSSYIIKWNIESCCRCIPSSSIDYNFEKFCTGEIMIWMVVGYIIYNTATYEFYDVGFCPIPLYITKSDTGKVGDNYGRNIKRSSKNSSYDSSRVIESNTKPVIITRRMITSRTNIHIGSSATTPITPTSCISRFCCHGICGRYSSNGKSSIRSCPIQWGWLSSKSDCISYFCGTCECCIGSTINTIFPSDYWDSCLSIHPCESYCIW